MLLEIRENDDKEAVVRLKIKNGTSDDAYGTYNFMRTTGDVPLSTLFDYLTVGSTLLFPSFHNLTTYLKANGNQFYPGMV
jgi:hypothetical protein